jgi:Flp pilus assembly protein TadG
MAETTYKTRRTGLANRAVDGVWNESGQATVFALLCMTALIGFVGLGVDVGHFHYMQRNLQTAADAAALAAATEARICGGIENCDAMQAAAQAAMTENGYTVDKFITNCSDQPGTGLTLMIDNPSCYDPNDPNRGAKKLNYVEAVVTDHVPTYFARIVGINSVTLTTRAEAEHGVGGPCIYALDPNAAGAIALGVGVLLNSQCGIVDESDNAAALECLVGLGITAPSIQVTGGASGLLGGILCGSHPPPHTYVAAPNPRDPLAYLPAPASASNSCGTTTASPYTGSPSQVSVLLGLGSNIVFNPGVYCGGINITASLLSTITFNPGTYILRQGSGGLLGLGTTGGLTITISALSTITGSGVTFYSEAGSNSAVNGFSITAPSTLGLFDFNLSAPTDGEYGGVLFFEAHGNTSPSSFLLALAQGSGLTGAIYTPDAPLSYGVSALSASYNILVAKDISLIGGIISTFGNDYSSLESGSPLDGDDVALVQ